MSFSNLKVQGFSRLSEQLTPLIMVEHATINNIRELISNSCNGQERISLQQDETSPLPVADQLLLVNFNISGKRFTISQQVLDKYPQSYLTARAGLEKHWLKSKSAYYFDRDPVLFNSVLNIFRHDCLTVPPGYSELLVREELEYWNLSASYSQSDDVDADNDDSSSQSLERDFLWMEDRIPPPRNCDSTWVKKRYKIWCFLTDPLGPNTSWRKLSLSWAVLTILLTLLFMVMFGLSTSPSYREILHSQPHIDNESLVVRTNQAPNCTLKIDCFLGSRPLLWIDFTLVALMCFFVIETVGRIAFCPDHGIYFKSLINWVDMITTFCAVIGIFFHLQELQPAASSHVSKSWAYANIALQGIQVLRIFKILQYATLLDGLLVMMLTLKASFYELLILMSYLVMAMLLFSTLITFVELSAHVDTGIPDSLVGYWWALVTMTTVGYGDYYPETTLGHMVGSLCAISGLIMTALPVAIIGSNFNAYWEHNKKRRRLQLSRLKRKRKSRNNNLKNLLLTMRNQAKVVDQDF